MRSSRQRPISLPSLTKLQNRSRSNLQATMLGGTYLLTKLLLPALEKAAMTAEDSTSAASTSAEGGADSIPGGGKRGARVINVSSGGMYTVSGAGVAADLDSKGVDPYDGTVV